MSITNEEALKQLIEIAKGQVKKHDERLAKDILEDKNGFYKNLDVSSIEDYIEKFGSTENQNYMLDENGELDFWCIDFPYDKLQGANPDNSARISGLPKQLGRECEGYVLGLWYQKAVSPIIALDFYNKVMNDELDKQEMEIKKYSYPNIRFDYDDVESIEYSNYSEGDKVLHYAFGEGIVKNIVGEGFNAKVHVEFLNCEQIIHAGLEPLKII